MKASNTKTKTENSSSMSSSSSRSSSNKSSSSSTFELFFWFLFSFFFPQKFSKARESSSVGRATRAADTHTPQKILSDDMNMSSRLS